MLIREHYDENGRVPELTEAEAKQFRMPATPERFVCRVSIGGLTVV